MFEHKKQLLHEVKVEKPNPQYAVLMQEQLGGGNGELKAAMQYISQSFRIKDPEIKDLFLDIGAEELSHMEMVAQTINLLNGNNTITFSILNNVCAFAICLAASVGSIAVTIATIGLLNININIIDPNTLKVKCIIAALLAFLLAPILEINEVTHVPIYSPNSIGKAAVIGINPWEARAINIPIEALELCTIAVIVLLISDGAQSLITYL